MEKVNPAGVKSEGYLAETSAVVWPPIGIALARPLTRITVKKAIIIPPQSLTDLSFMIDLPWIRKEQDCGKSYAAADG
jgi:hypothetical protein